MIEIQKPHTYTIYVRYSGENKDEYIAEDMRGHRATINCYELEPGLDAKDIVARDLAFMLGVENGTLIRGRGDDRRYSAVYILVPTAEGAEA